MNDDSSWAPSGPPTPGMAHSTYVCRTVLGSALGSGVTNAGVPSATAGAGMVAIRPGAPGRCPPAGGLPLGERTPHSAGGTAAHGRPTLRALLGAGRGRGRPRSSCRGRPRRQGGRPWRGGERSAKRAAAIWWGLRSTWALAIRKGDRIRGKGTTYRLDAQDGREWTAPEPVQPDGPIAADPFGDIDLLRSAPR